MILSETSWAGIGLAGNPSDGYFGRALALPATNFSASATLYESPEINLIPTAQDHATFANLADMSADVETYGYYGGIRLLKAATRIFLEHCEATGIQLPARNFTARYSSSIPRRVGLAETSAVVTAMLKALLRFYEVPVERAQLPRLAWMTERDELGIPCGLMDRVVQTYGCPVFMDLNRSAMEQEGHGRYERIPADCIPAFMLAIPQGPRATGADYHRALGIHLQEENGDLRKHMKEFAALATEARDALLARDYEQLGTLMNRNFDLRQRLFPLSEAETAVVDAVRKLGLAAKLAGGSGTVVGLCSDDTCMARLTEAVRPFGYSVAPLRLPEETADPEMS